MAFIDIAAKSAAIIATFSKYPGMEDNVSPPEFFDMLMAVETDEDMIDFIKRTKTASFQHFKFQSAADIQHWLQMYSNSIREHLNQYAQAIHLGLIVRAIDCSIGTDINQWNMNDIASFGYNIDSEWKINQEIFKFDPMSLQWVSKTSSTSLEYDPATGLPLIENQTAKLEEVI